jgi:hypothetical protein
MLNFREFQAGPDPFGRTYQVLLKWMQTAISIRHSDTVDVRFVLQCAGSRTEKTVALRHAELVKLGREAGREITDAWCSRLAVGYPQLQGYAAELAREEKADIARRGAA